MNKKTFSILLCLITIVVSSGAIAPKNALADVRLPGGWYVDNHLTWDEWLANKDATKLVANAPKQVCRVLSYFGPPGRVLSVYCSAQAYWWQRTAKKAQQQGRCFRVVVPAHNLNWAYSSTHKRSWCR
jgi:hypothetical protein